jgi:hypothetical protein
MSVKLDINEHQENLLLNSAFSQIQSLSSYLARLMRIQGNLSQAYNVRVQIGSVALSILKCRTSQKQHSSETKLLEINRSIAIGYFKDPAGSTPSLDHQFTVLNLT